MLWHLAYHATNEMTQVRAATQLHAIYAGRPAARAITLEVDGLDALSDEELAALQIQNEMKMP